MVESLPGKELVAVIDIGSSAIRMVIAQIISKSEIRNLENVQKPIRFGKDVFKTGRISHTVMRDGLKILIGFKSLIDEYGVKRVNAIATSAFREAANRDNLLDQIFVRTGIDVEIIESAEENRLELIAVEKALKGQFEFEKRDCLIIEVGTGHTELILMTKGEVSVTRALPIGSIRLPELSETDRLDAGLVQRVLKRQIRFAAAELAREFSLEKINAFIAVGGDVRFLARHLVDKPNENFATIEPEKFLDFVKKLAKLSADDMVAEFRLSYEEAETLFPALLIYANFLSETKADSVIIPMVSIRDGLLIEMSQLVSGQKRSDLTQQVTHSAKSIGKKYQYGESHALCVSRLALKLFDLLKEDHGLGSRERLLLEVSAILHDIGVFISASSHHKHGAYLVDAEEIFGLRKSDKEIVANVIRYHRRSGPKSTHVSYMSLPRTDRAVVAKLAAILRVADALDRSHQQKISQFELERKIDAYVLWVGDDAGDISMERQALVEKGEMFTEVFGALLSLKQGALSRP